MGYIISEKYYIVIFYTKYILYANLTYYKNIYNKNKAIK